MAYIILGPDLQNIIRLSLVYRKIDFHCLYLMLARTLTCHNLWHAKTTTVGLPEAYAQSSPEMRQMDTTKSSYNQQQLPHVTSSQN